MQLKLAEAWPRSLSKPGVLWLERLCGVAGLRYGTNRLQYNPAESSGSRCKSSTLPKLLQHTAA